MCQKLEVLELQKIEVYSIFILLLRGYLNKIGKKKKNEKLAWIAFYTTYGSLPRMKKNDYVLCPNKYQ